MSDEIKYLDFEIVVTKSAGDDYLVRAKSGKGKAEHRFANPFNEDKRKVVRSTLIAAALRSSGKAKVRSGAAPEVREMKTFGALLFQEAVSGPVRDFYQKCQAQADREHAGMRVRLTLDNSVDDLPWEFLCQQDDFMALNPRSPIVRYIEGAASCSLVKVEYPLRVLVVIAKPSDEVPLDTDAEKQSITAALKPLTDQAIVHLTFIEGNNTWKKLMNALLPNRTHILHFIGHGTFDETNGEGVLIMADKDGKTELVDSERLRVLVLGRSRLALIVLNSCLGTAGGDAQPFSSVAAGLIKSGIPAVIAMQFEISDEAAREISETFYTSLTLNLPVDAALTEARRRIFLSNRNSLEWATPILYMQVPDGQLFEFKGARPDSVSQPPPSKPPLEATAAKKYAEGEEAMARGDWEKAVNGYRGAMVYVPNYRDASEKLAICAGRLNAASLLEKAQEAVSKKEYGRALEALNEAVKLDPTLNVDQLRGTAECGEKYQRALTALKQRNIEVGTTLLREIVSVRQDFEDAAQRLENLAAGGDGLLGRLATRDEDSTETAEDQSGWKNRFNQIYNWATATPEVEYHPPPGTEPEPPGDKDLFDKGRELWQGGFGIFRSKSPSGPLPRKIEPEPPPPAMPPPPKQLAEPPAQTQTPPVPVNPPKTEPSRTAKERSPRGTARTQTPPDRLIETRLYQTGLDPKFVAESISQYLTSQRCESQILQSGGVWIVQGRQTERRQTRNPGLVATLVLEQSPARLRGSIGGGAWIAQGSFETISADPAPSLITGAIDMADRRTLIEILWSIVERFVSQSGGRRLA